MLLLVKEFKIHVLKSAKILIFSLHFFLMRIYAHLILEIDNSNVLWFLV